MVGANYSGLHAAVHPSIRTELEGLSAGVAISCQWATALYECAIPAEVEIPTVERCIARLWYGPFKDPLLLVSAYFHTGSLTSAVNRTLLDTIAAWLKAMGRPFLIGADWQDDPDVLIELGWLDEVAGQVFAPDDHTFSSNGHETKIDYWVVSRSIDFIVNKCYTNPISTIPGHDPVILEITAEAKSATVMKPKRIPRLPAEVPKGCALPPPTWEDFSADIAAVQGHVDIA